MADEELGVQSSKTLASSSAASPGDQIISSTTSTFTTHGITTGTTVADVFDEDSGALLAERRVVWEQGAPDSPLHVISATDSAGGEDAATGGGGGAALESGAGPATSVAAPSLMPPLGVVKRVLYRLKQEPEGPTFAEFLTGVAKRYSVPRESVRAIAPSGNEVALSTPISEFMEDFDVVINEAATGLTKVWQFWFERDGRELGHVDAATARPMTMLAPLPTAALEAGTALGGSGSGGAVGEAGGDGGMATTGKRGREAAGFPPSSSYEGEEEGPPAAKRRVTFGGAGGAAMASPSEVPPVTGDDRDPTTGSST